MDNHQSVDTQAAGTSRWTWAAMEGYAGGAQWHLMDSAHRGAVARFTRSVSAVSNLSSAISAVESGGSLAEGIAGVGRGFTEAREAGHDRMFHRWDIRRGEKRGLCVGKTKRGKGTKLMAVSDRAGLPVALHVSSASPHEVTLVEATLKDRFTHARPERMIGDKAYDSDPLDARLKRWGTQMIAPHRGKRTKKATQDGRPLRRYARRWKIERLFAWLQNFRRLVTRYEYHVENFLGFVYLGCLMILLRRYL